MAVQDWDKPQSVVHGFVQRVVAKACGATAYHALLQEFGYSPAQSQMISIDRAPEVGAYPGLHDDKGASLHLSAMLFEAYT